MQYYVYFLTNQDNNVLYVGVTNNLLRRVYEHRNSLNPKSFTTRYRAYKLVYFEATNDVRIAIEREKQIKGWNRKRKDRLIESINPNWNDLCDIIYDQ